MTDIALGLVLLSAFAHATWNLIAKRAGASLAFTMLFHLVAALLCTPLAVVLLVTQRPAFGAPELVAISGSSIIHLIYFLLLSQGYKSGELSLVYPLARGTGPMIASVAAIIIFGERPTALALCGAVLIGMGVFVLAGDPRKLRQSGAGRSVAFALLTGVSIAGYTLWDKRAVSFVGVPPLIYFWGFTSGTAAILAPFVAHPVAKLWVEWQTKWREVLSTGALVAVAYVLVLTALSTSPVSYVAPAREVGILIGTLMGARLLAEGETRRRLAGAAAMVLGVVALALG